MSETMQWTDRKVGPVRGPELVEVDGGLRLMVRLLEGSKTSAWYFDTKESKQAEAFAEKLAREAK